MINRMKKTLTIIIPTYNVERYIVGAINSILKQNSNEYTIIIVDDCSTDKTVSLIRQNFGEKIKDGTITMIESEVNGGSAIARQKGLEIVDTPYVTFMDADDSYASDSAISLMTASIEKTHADMYMFKYITDHGRIKLKKQYRLSTRVLSGKEAMIDKITRKQPIWHYLWNKCYKMSVIKKNHIAFLPELRRAQDVRFNEDYLIHAATVCFIDRYLYIYNCCNACSVSQKRSSRKPSKEEILNVWRKACRDYDRVVENSKLIGCEAELDRTMKEDLCGVMLTMCSKADDAGVGKEVKSEIVSSAHYQQIKDSVCVVRFRFFFKNIKQRIRLGVKRIIKK